MSNHIQLFDDATKSLCGETLGNEFYFKNIERAVLNGLHEAHIAACPKCVDRVIECLKRSKHYHEEKVIDGNGNNSILLRN